MTFVSSIYSIKFTRFSYTVACISTSFLLVAKYYINNATIILQKPTRIFFFFHQNEKAVCWQWLYSLYDKMHYIHKWLYSFLEKEMATHSSILAWRILWTEEPGGLLSIGSHRVRHDWSSLGCMHALEKEMAAPSSFLAWGIPGTEEPGGLPSMGLHRVGHNWSNLVAAAAYSFLKVSRTLRKQLHPNCFIQRWQSLLMTNISSFPKS